MDNTVSFSDVFIAYRKAKVDAFYETGKVTAHKFAHYEENLVKELDNLIKNINGKDEEWVCNAKFCGGFRFTLKDVQYVPQDSKIFISDQARKWKESKINEVTYRIIGDHPINFHILSSLWIDKIGAKLDSKGKKNSYGCRLKNLIQSDGKTIPNTHGHFNHYIYSYQKWQNDGLEAIRNALNENKKVIAFTSDIVKFYHRIDPGFLLDDNFFASLNIELSDAEKKINRLLIKAMKFWSQQVFKSKTVPKEFKNNKHCGIPLGIGASKVIANAILIQLDTDIQEKVSPLYYGRYVDDIFLVMHDHGIIHSQQDLWDFIDERVDSLNIKTTQKNKAKVQKIKGIEYELAYSPKTMLEFGQEKGKLFFLEGTSGLTFLQTLEESMAENSSEWNMPPDLDNDIESFTKEVSRSSIDNEEPANGIRKADGVSIQRMKFILYLRRMEIIVKFMPESAWERSINAFMNLCIDYAVTPDTIATYTKYYPRIVSLAINADKQFFVNKLMKRIDESFDHLEKAKGTNNALLNSCKRLIYDQIWEAGVRTIKPEEGKVIAEWDTMLLGRGTNAGHIHAALLPIMLFKADLHTVSIKEAIVTNNRNFSNCFSAEDKEANCYEIIKNECSNLLNTDGLEVLLRNKLVKKYLNDTKPVGMVCYTRAFNLPELSLIFNTEMP